MFAGIKTMLIFVAQMKHVQHINIQVAKAMITRRGDEPSCPEGFVYCLASHK